jgi:alkylation response protein AidB-like acyl-CoA dehydrogenase
MDFLLPLELREETKRARRFAEEHAPSGERGPHLDRETWRAASSFGLFKSALPEDWGGSARGALAAFVLFEAMGQGGMDRSLLFAMGAHLFGCAVPIATYASPTQSAKWGPGLADGSIVGALAVTEPAGGSSLDLIATEVADAPGGVSLTGEKTLVCNAPDAGLFLVLARQFKNRGPLGFTAVLVPGDAPGVRVTPMAPTLGLRGAPMGRVALEGCFVPAEMVLGRPGAGLRIFATAMQWERTCLLAGFLGAAKRDLALSIDALRARRDGEGSVLRHQAVSHRLARLKLKLEAARLLGLRAAWIIDERRDDPTSASMAKLALSEAVVETAEELLKLMAGSAWQGRPIDFGAALNDAMGGLFASGTSEIQLDIIARSLVSKTLTQ